MRCASDRARPAFHRQHQQLPMAIHSFHRFIHNKCLGMQPIDTAFTGCPGPQLWITAGWYRCAINNPNRYASEMGCRSKHSHRGLAGPGGPYPVSPGSGRRYAVRFPTPLQAVMITVTKLGCDSPHSRQVGCRRKAMYGHAFVRSGFAGPVELVFRLACLEQQLRDRRVARRPDRAGVARGSRHHRLGLNRLQPGASPQRSSLRRAR